MQSEDLIFHFCQFNRRQTRARTTRCSPHVEADGREPHLPDRIPLQIRAQHGKVLRGDDQAVHRGLPDHPNFAFQIPVAIYYEGTYILNILKVSMKVYRYLCIGSI